MNKLTILAAVILLGALNANVVKADAEHSSPNPQEAEMVPGFDMEQPRVPTETPEGSY